MKSTLFLLLLATSAFGQQPNRSYYNQYGAESDSAGSYYYTEYDGQSWVSRYTMTNTVRYREQDTDQKNIKVRTDLYPGGEKRSEGRFEFDSPIGEFKSYYRNGQQQAVLDFKKPLGDQQLLNGLLLNYWDSLGNQLVTNGNGRCVCDRIPEYDEHWNLKGEIKKGVRSGQWSGSRTDDSYFVEMYDDAGALLRGEMFSGGTTYKYDQLEARAEPKDGLAAFYKVITQYMVYPKQARRAGIQGKVFVEFIIGKDGRVTNVRTVKGIDPECDSVAEEAVKRSPPWIPGTQRGRPVKQRMVLPLTFKLG